ncbi:redoxin domain-containing protein [Pedobacter deserti]|uniref:redoxin domain-containing protein n=1 Tax=Pedobacter deserti TaxID=2817382 RepID=UPI00210EE879|nr:redoxin domain-containing protein [Pedobacter sp. SYSU D00382]
MKIYITAVLLFCGSSLAFSQQTVTIKGTVKNDLKGHNKVYVYGEGIETDTAEVRSGSFEISLPFTKPFIPLLYSQYEAEVNKAVAPFPIIIDQPGIVHLEGADLSKGFHTGKLSGMQSASDYQAYRAGYDKAAGEAENLRKFIEKRPDTYLAAYLLYGSKGNLDMGTLESLYAKLKPNAQKSELGIKVKEFIAGAKSSAIGMVAKDLSLSGPDGQTINLNQFRGKYVLLDFWASWCGPCKASFPHMKKVYSKYKGDQFEIYSISVDQSKADWLKALKELELPWTQALDHDKIASTSFAVSAVPTTFLIGPDGRILMKDIGFDSSGNSTLEKKLAELFPSK